MARGGPITLAAIIRGTTRPRSVWVEARDKGDRERFVNYRASRLFDSSLCHKLTQLCVAVLQLLPKLPSMDIYACAHEPQEVGTFLGKQKSYIGLFTSSFSHRDILGAPFPGYCRSRTMGAHQSPLRPSRSKGVCSLHFHRSVFGHGKVKNRGRAGPLHHTPQPRVNRSVWPPVKYSMC